MTIRKPVTDIPNEPLVVIEDRASLIRWLRWNDHNGCYSDKERRSEDAEPATLGELQTHYFKQTIECDDWHWVNALEEALDNELFWRSGALMLLLHDEGMEAVDAIAYVQNNEVAGKPA